MKDKPSAYGAEPEQIDRLLAWPLGDDMEAARTPGPGLNAEGPGGRIGRYQLLEVLGEGGMGVVYLAEQHEPIQREVALKVIKPGMDSARVIARFEAEQQALALMDHPHVARVFDAGLAPSGRPYFVMEHVRGIPITEHCDKQRLTIEQRLTLFLHVCEAVQHAHQKGIIHRDLKPSNILVAMQDQEAVPKVIDFGVARAMSQPLTEQTVYTEQGQLVGTPEYMSPEQANMAAEDVDTRSDIYSLGVLLYELLTGALPFDRETLREGGIDHLRQVICEKDPKTPSTRLAQLQASNKSKIQNQKSKIANDLDWITLKAMDKDRTRRYASVDAMAMDIRKYLNHQPVSAAPPTVRYRAKKFIQRHRQGVAGACVALILLVVMLWAVLTSIRAHREHALFEASEHERLLLQAQDAYGNGDRDDALAKVDPLLTSPHVARRARLFRAKLVLEEKGAGAAVPELERLVDITDEVAGQAHFLLANIYYEADPCAPGDTSEFQQRWQTHREQAEQLIAGTGQYYFLRAQAAHGVKEMLDMLGQALKLDKQHYHSLRARAHIYYSQHDYEKMAIDAARMIGIRPSTPQGYALCALALQELGQLDEALQNHNEAIQLAPEDPQLYDGRRETYTRLGQYELALRDAEKCTKLQPQDISFRHKLFAAYTVMGRYEEAQREYERFLSYPFLQENLIGRVPWYLKGLFYLFSSKLIGESVAANRMWHGPREPPYRAPYAWMYEVDTRYRSLHTQAQCLVRKGFHPAWSPDGRRLAYSHGLLSASGVAVLNIESGRTELLTTSGKDPEWSPDGRHIAFVRDRRIWSIQSLASFSVRTYRPYGRVPRHPDEVWVVDMETHEFQRLCAGSCPHWGRRSGRLYYRQNKMLYSMSRSEVISLLRRGSRTMNLSTTHTDTRPVEVLSPCGRSPVISPDERHIADHISREVRIIDADSKEVVATWIAPPSPLGGLNISWSPDSRELSICGSNAGEMGLWIYDIETGEASQVLNGGWFTSCWAPDSSKMTLTLGVPEIWQVDLESGVPTVASFDSVQTIEAHCLNLMERLNHWISMDPGLVHTQYLRADCALWMDHPKAAEYLQQFEQALPPYKAANCAREAQWMVDATPELRDRFLPLALLLARKAVEKEPENVEFRWILAQVQEYQDKLSAQRQSRQ